MTPIDFPDQIHLEKIRAALWCGREHGRASLMLGAGFSRNADRLSPSTPPFPLLQGLATTMYECLYPSTALNPDQEIKKAQATFGAGVLKLAREYEAEFGRPSLDELLLTSLPDDAYVPGRLHRLLLSLPWSDVFTTNYDTLLERTRPSIHERKYDLVQTVSDIPGRMKPRIVKLHGSFPSHRPFIITEDDYRLYPTRFAPFVNMVQQSIMENSLCLLGFSGDDPNFLYWSGWVRDNLKEATPTIYLCGLLHLSPATRQVLLSRRIVPIDLSPLFPDSTWPDSDLRHSKAIEWLLLNLMHGEAPDLIGWPEPLGEPKAQPSQGLPLIPPGPKKLSGNGPLYPHFQPGRAQDLVSLCNIWRLNRLQYPGWAIAPNENRDTIWRYTENWIDTIIKSVAGVPFPDNILLLYELNWRLELTLTSLFLHEAETIARLLNEINPFPQLIDISSAKFRPDFRQHVEADWAEVSKCWLELAFALAREAREDLDEARFRLWMDRLNLVISQESEFRARWFYEEASFCLFQLNQKGLIRVLNDWPRMPELPFWEAKRASMLTEVGRAHDAERIAEEALAKIRSRLHPYKFDYALMSQEGFVMMLLKAISTSVRLFQEPKERFQTRWVKLETFGCNPWSEIQLFRLALNAHQPEPLPATERHAAFDPSRGNVMHHSQSGVRTADFRSAFGLLRFCDEGALPMKSGLLSILSGERVTAAKWISRFAPLWSLSIAIRAGDDKWIKETYDRVCIATITNDGVNSIYAFCAASFIQAIEGLSANSDGTDTQFHCRLIPTLAELLSRLAFRLSADKKAAIFDAGVALYNSHAVRQNVSLFSCILPLITRTTFAMSKEEVLKRIPILLSLQIPGESGFEVSPATELWPEPFECFELLARLQDNSNPTEVDWSVPVNRLVRLTSADNPKLVRKRAAARLAKIEQLGLLTPEQRTRFAEALWSETDPDSHLPSNTGFHHWAFLKLPEVNQGRARELVRTYLLATETPRMFQRTRSADGSEHKSFNLAVTENGYLHEVIAATKPLFPSLEDERLLVDWSTEESVVFLTKIASWWREESRELRGTNRGFMVDPVEQLRCWFHGIISILAKVLLPRLKDADETAKKMAIDLLSEMNQSGFCVLAALPMSLFICPETFDEVASRMRRGLISTTANDAEETMAGLFCWLAYAQQNQISSPPNDLLMELVHKIKTRTQPALVTALAQMCAIIRQMPTVLCDEHISELSIGLDYLLAETNCATYAAPGVVADDRVVPKVDILRFREYASALASQIFAWCNQRCKPIPPPILKWREVSVADVLPEVRHNWESPVEVT